MARIGYAKMGRSYSLDPNKATSMGGDADVLNCLQRLARAHPEHTFVLIGKNSGENPQQMGFPANVENPWTEWQERWETAPNPEEADKIITHMRDVCGDAHKKLDAFIMWAGQHGSANSRIPMIGAEWIKPPGWEMIDYDVSRGEEWSNARNDIITGGTATELATPQFAFIHYVSWLMDFIGRWREFKGPEKAEEIWLCPDPRNYLKVRELRWPVIYPVLAQHNFAKYHKGERYGRFPQTLKNLDPTGYQDKTIWVSNLQYCYSGLELTAVDGPGIIEFDPRPGEHPFGMVVNENLVGGKLGRRQIIESWVLPYFPDPIIRGHWTEKTQLEMKRVFEPVPYTEAAAVMKSFATTLTTPASNSGWATAKPWEAFALGSVCFFHPGYDDQGHILPNADESGSALLSDDSRMLAAYLRCPTPEIFAKRVSEVWENPDMYFAIVTAQRRHYEAAFDHWHGGTLAIEDRIACELGEGPLRPWTTRKTTPAAKVTSRLAARPRGTNAEKKRGPPISRRRALKNMPPAVTEEVTITQEQADAAVAEYTPPIIGVTPGIKIDAGTAQIVPRPTHTAAEAPQPEPSVLRMPTMTFTGGGGITGRFSASSPNVAARPSVVKRESWDEFFIRQATEYAKRSTCARRSVGCILVDENNKQIGQGYNGVPRGFPHCNEGNPCPGAGSPSGTDLQRCYSAHAESNALLSCTAVDRIRSVYLTVSPCVECVKVLLNTSATRIVFLDEYPQPQAQELWLRRPGNTWEKLER